MGRVLLIDSNNALSRYQNVYTEAKSPSGLPIGGLYGMLEGVKRFMLENPDHSSVVFTVDAGVPAWRKEICPEYKAQRESKRTPKEEQIHKDARAQVPHVRRVTRWLGCGFARAESWEADDVIGALTERRFADRGVTIYSSDNDYIELIDGKRVKMYNAIDRVWKPSNPNYLFERLIDPKASDNLDGVPGIAKVGAARIVSFFTEKIMPNMGIVAPRGKAALEAFLEMCRMIAEKGADKKADSETKKLCKLASLITPKADKVRANYKVTCLRRSAKACDADTVLKVSPFDGNKFDDIAREYGMRPIREDMRMFKTVFGRLDHSWLVPTLKAA